MADEITEPARQPGSESAAPSLDDLVQNLVSLESAAMSEAPPKAVLTAEFRVELRSMVAQQLRNDGRGQDVGALLDRALELWVDQS